MIKCWLYRRIISRSADENAPLSQAAQAHLAECRECRRFCETEYEIVRRLNASAAARKRQQPPPFLHSRIMASIAASKPDTRVATGLSFLRRPASLALLAILASGLTAVFLWLGRPASEPNLPQAARMQPPPAVTTVPTMEWPNPATLTEWATTPDKPLDTEIQAILHDARGAMTALADNFLPEKLRPPASAHSSTQEKSSASSDTLRM
jgi:hypothetical protein